MEVPKFENGTSLTGSSDIRIIDLPDNSVNATVLIEFTRLKSIEADVDIRPSQLNILDASGWLEVDVPQAKEMGSVTLGRTELIAFSGEGTRLLVDGVRIDVAPMATVVAGGSMQGHWLESGNVALTGRSNMLWMGQNRLNPTRWERMATELQVLILTLVGIFGVWLVRTVLRVRGVFLKNLNYR